MQPAIPTRYQFQPARTGPVLGIALGMAALLFIPPTIAGFAVSGREPAAEPVNLTEMFGSDVDKPVLIDGRPLECPAYFESTLLNGFKCDDALIESFVHGAQDDPEHTLRRMVRAGTMGVADGEATVQTYGDTLAITDSTYGLLAFLAPIENDQLLYVQVDILTFGSGASELAEATWSAVHDESLPPELSAELSAQTGLSPGIGGGLGESLKGVSDEQRV